MTINVLYTLISVMKRSFSLSSTSVLWGFVQCRHAGSIHLRVCESLLENLNAIPEKHLMSGGRRGEPEGKPRLISPQGKFWRQVGPWSCSAVKQGYAIRSTIDAAVRRSRMLHRLLIVCTCAIHHNFSLKLPSAIYNFNYEGNTTAARWR